MNKANQVQILNEAVLISHSSNTATKFMTLRVLFPFMVGQNELFNLSKVTDLGESKIYIRTWLVKG